MSYLNFILIWILVLILKYSNETQPSVVFLTMASAAIVLFFKFRNFKILQLNEVTVWRSLLIGLIAIHLTYAASHLRHPPTNDVGVTTIAAGTLLEHGWNPYTHAVDTGAAKLLDGTRYAEDRNFSGFKYGPIMAIAYVPLSVILGDRSLVITNFILMCAVLTLVYRLAAGEQVGGSVFGYRAACLCASLPIIIFQLYSKGTTDVVPTALLLLGFVMYSRYHFATGVCLGLSISAKIFPALVVAPLLLPKEGRWEYIGGLLVGLFPLLAFTVKSPVLVVDNLIWFNELRQMDATSWLYHDPKWVITCVRAAFIGLWFSAIGWVLFRPVRLHRLMTVACMLIIGLILTGPGIHENYAVWWLPLFAAIVCARPPVPTLPP